MRKINITLPYILTFIFLFLNCNSNSKQNSSVEVDENGYAVLTDEQIENMEGT